MHPPPSIPSSRRPFTVLLLLAACGIWGYVAVQVVETLGAEAAEGTAHEALPEPSALPVRPAGPGSYVADFRPPFGPPAAWFTPAPAEAEPVPAEPVPPERPPLALLGIIHQEALVQDAAGRVYFLSRGDTLAGVRIEYLTADHAVVCFNGVSFTLTIGE